MAENGSKSKLKRKKSSVEDQQSETCPRGPPKGSGVTLLSRDEATLTDRSLLPAAAAWWNKVQPPAVESLWAFTLMSALPHLQNQSWDPVPDFPFHPAVRPAESKVEEQWTYDFFREVPPFPEDCPLIPKIPSGLHPQNTCSLQENLEVQTRASVKAHGGPSSCCRWIPEQQTEPLQPLLSRSQKSTLHRWEKAASSSAEQLRDVGEQEQCSGSASKQLPTESVKVSNPPDSTKEEEEVMSVGKREEALQSCPMCLHVFPAGFTQMERDSHLAQCLSEMNVDMTW